MLELESRRFEVLNLSWDEREVGVRHVEDLKKKKKNLPIVLVTEVDEFDES